MKKNKKFIFLLIIVIPMSILFVLFVLFQINSNNYISEDLKEKNLKGYVKNIMKNGDFIVENTIMHFNSKGDLKASVNVSISTTNISFDATSKAKQTAIYNIVLYVKTKDTIIDVEKAFTKNQSLINLMRKKYEKQIDLFAEKKQRYYIKDEIYLKVAKYNNNGQITQEYKINTKGNITSNHYIKYSNDSIYTFYQKDNSVIQIKHNVNEENYELIHNRKNSLSNRYVKLYEKDKIIREDIYDRDGVKWSFTNYIYNDKGLLSKEINYNDESKSKYEQSILSAIFGERKKRSSTSFQYILDDYGNWTTKIIIKNSEHQKITRNITYYNFWDYLKNKLGV